MVKDAIASIYCMVREIIGEEDRITTYAAGEYAYFDEKAFEEEDEEEKEKYANEKKKRKKYCKRVDKIIALYIIA